MDEVSQGRRESAPPDEARGAASTPRSGSGDRIRPVSAVTPSVSERSAQPYAKIVRQVTDGIPAAVDGVFPRLYAWLGERGIAPLGPPFIRTTEIDRNGEPVELELGVPVRDEVAAEGEIAADTLPAGRFLTLVHVGPYRSETETDLEDARASLLQFAERRGLAWGHPTDRGHAPACAVEHLHVGPTDTPDHSRWKTEFAYLIVEE